MGRLYVHLSDNKDTALAVGKRHGKPIFIVIDAKHMYEDGCKFYLSNNGVWLTEKVDPKYFLLTSNAFI
jgi:putative RNA 2'-phosphotransferase